MLFLLIPATMRKLFAVVPDEEILELPERVLQFRTGMLLRGLPDYFIDKANRMGIFNGGIVMVKTTSRGDAPLSFFLRITLIFCFCNCETKSERDIDFFESTQSTAIFQKFLRR